MMSSERSTAEPPKEKKKLIVLNSTNIEQKYKWNFSASQIDMWNLCKAKWAFRYVDGIRGQNKFAKRGSDTHAHLEAWLIDGIEPPLEDRYGALARTGLKHLPLPGEAFIERGFKFISPSGISYLAYLDIEFFDKLISMPVVGDHKTTTDFKWNHTSESLVQNVQAVLYSNISFLNWQRDEVMLRWVYYKDSKNRPTSKKVEAKVQRADMSAKLVKIDAIAEEIALHGLTAKQAKDLPRNALACDQYGGCPYREICGVTDAEYLGARMQQMSIRDRLMAGKAKAEEIHQTESVQQAVAQATEPTIQPLSALDKMRLKAVEAAKSQTSGASTNVSTEKTSVAAQAAPVATHNQTSTAVPAVTTAPISKPGGLLARLANLKKPVDQTTSVAQTPATPNQTTQVESVPQPAPAEAAIPTHTVNAFDVNPPEQPRAEQIQDDPDTLSASVAGEKAIQKGKTPATVVATSADAAEKKPRGRPAGSTTVKPLSDEGYIFARVYAEVCRESRGDNSMATACATAAVKAFRDLD